MDVDGDTSRWRLIWQLIAILVLEHILEHERHFFSCHGIVQELQANRV